MQGSTSCEVQCSVIKACVDVCVAVAVWRYVCVDVC